jgi:hypothetical protein
MVGNFAAPTQRYPARRVDIAPVVAVDGGSKSDR